jgi:hypothetical protein
MDGQQLQPQPQPQPQQQPGNGRRQQRNRRANNKTVQYTSVEVHALLRLVEQMLPVDGEDWEEVARLHNLNFPTNGRDAAKLKRKFQQLYRVEMPTGDPMCPPEVRIAKRIREKIRDKSEIDDGEEELVLPDGTIQEDVELQAFDAVDDASEGEEGLEEALENNNNVINNENLVVGNANNVAHRARAASNNNINNNRALTPINNNISQIASARKIQKKRAGTDDLIECYKLKFLQKEDENEAVRLRWQQEREDRAAAMEADLKRMRMESELRREEEEIRYRREAEERRAEARAKAEADASFREMMMMMMFGGNYKKPSAN